MPENENKRKIVHWTEIELPNRPIQPKREMLTERGYFDRKQVYGEVVLIRYDRSYISFWVKRFLLSRLGVSDRELFRLISDNLGVESVLGKPMSQPFETNIPGLGKATFAEFFQFLSEETEKGRFWMIFDNVSDRCLFLTDNAEPGRLVVPPHQYIGLNRLDAWRDSMDEYERLQHLLKTEKVAPSFEANCYRLNDSFVHFQKSIYLIEGLFGTQCRASVSEGWEVIRPANIE